MPRSVQFVLCMDTEGPLHESTEACFQRINATFGLSLKPSEETLRKLQNAEIDLGGCEAAIQKMVSPQVRDWLGSWTEVLDNVRHCMTARYRSQLVDDRGRGLVFNWFINDWIGFEHNPRRKAIGINRVFSEYWNLFADSRADNPIYFHHHARPFSSATHHPCRNWTNDNSHVLKLSANLLEFGHFPACVRTPIMAPDIHLFLEQYFPFDLSNTSVSSDGQPDIVGRRWTDWHGAPDDWSLYRPDIRDYRRPGSSERAIGRCVQLGSRYGNLDRDELIKGFEKARAGEDVLVGCHAHDHSPVGKFAPYFELVNDVRREYPDVEFRNATAVEGFRAALGIADEAPPRLSLRLEGNSLFIECDKDLFGSQPWFCFKTRDNRYLWDNLDWLEPRVWRYMFDDYTMPLSLVGRVGAGSADKAGNVGVCRADIIDGQLGAAPN